MCAEVFAVANRPKPSIEATDQSKFLILCSFASPIYNKTKSKHSIRGRTALDWGFDIPKTTARLMEVSSKAKENGPRYAALTAQNAAAAVERKGQKAGRG
jgi:hypothetical protein